MSTFSTPSKRPLSPTAERELHQRQLANLERIFPQMMKSLEPNNIVPILRARNFIDSTEMGVIHNMSCRQKRVQKLIEIVTRKRYWWAPLNHALNNGGYPHFAVLVVGAVSQAQNGYQPSPSNLPPAAQDTLILIQESDDLLENQQSECTPPEAKNNESVSQPNTPAKKKNNSSKKKTHQSEATDHSVSTTNATMEMCLDLMGNPANGKVNGNARLGCDLISPTIGTPTEVSVELPPLPGDPCNTSEVIFSQEDDPRPILDSPGVENMAPEEEGDNAGIESSVKSTGNVLIEAQ